MCYKHNSSYCTGVTVGLSQSLFKAYEGEPTVQVCAELLKGQLGTNLSLILQANNENDSGMYNVQWCDYVIDKLKLLTLSHIQQQVCIYT